MLGLGAKKLLLPAHLRTREEKITRVGKALFQQEKATQRVSFSRRTQRLQESRKKDAAANGPRPLSSTWVAALPVPVAGRPG